MPDPGYTQVTADQAGNGKWGPGSGASSTMTWAPEGGGVAFSPQQWANMTNAYRQKQAQDQQAAAQQQALQQPIAPPAANPITPQQNALVAQLQQLASGQGPSLAEQQLNQQFAAARARQTSLGASASPAMQGIAQAAAARGVGGIDAGAAGMINMGKLEEQGMARNALGNVLQGMAGLAQQPIMAQFQGDLAQRLQQLQAQSQQQLLQEQYNLWRQTQPDFGQKLLNGALGSIPFLGGLFK
jgi:hypothetical protein